MKIEPQKTNKIPKYAAALAAFASAVMLTACQPSGEMVVTDGTAPDPAVQGSNLELDGVAVTDAPIRLEGETSPETEPEVTETTVNGFVGMTTITGAATTAPDDDEIMLDGDVVCIPETTETGEAP